MSSWNRDVAIKCQVDLMEKEILYFKGDRRRKAKNAYLRHLLSCKYCDLQKPVYYLRR